MAADPSNADLDRDILDRDRSEAAAARRGVDQPPPIGRLAEMADEALAQLDHERQIAEEGALMDLERQMAILERECITEDDQDDPDPPERRTA